MLGGCTASCPAVSLGAFPGVPLPCAHLAFIVLPAAPGGAATPHNRVATCSKPLPAGCRLSNRISTESYVWRDTVFLARPAEHVLSLLAGRRADSGQPDSQVTAPQVTAKAVPSRWPPNMITAARPFAHSTQNVG